MLEKLFEIVENKRYDHVDFGTGVVKIYMKDGAYIRITKSWFREGGIFKGRRVDYFHIGAFIPNRDTAIESCRICEDQDMYKKIKELFDRVKQAAKDDAMDKYF